MEVKKVVEYEDLDALIPLIQKLYAETGIDRYVSLVGYISWITVSFPSSNFQIWKGEENGEVKGYLIAHITQRFLIKECCIVDAFIDENDEATVKTVYAKINEWARENECKQISIVSKREKAFARKYGFDYFGSVMIRKV